MGVGRGLGSRFVLGLVLTLIAGCSSAGTPLALPTATGVVSAELPAVTTSPPALPPFNPITPALQVTLLGGFTTDQAQAARALPGVAAVARVTLALVTADAPGGVRQLSLAVVDPLEFRPLTPAPTAEAAFVWQGLLTGNMYLAHEEQPALGAALGSSVPLKGPTGSIAPRIGGLAANGIPNLAGGLMSNQQAQGLGLPPPATLLIGVGGGVSLDDTSKKIVKLFPQAQVFRIATVVEHQLLSGSAASKLLGSFSFKGNPDGSIAQNSSWVNANIVTRTVPILGEVTCNKLMFRQLIGALTELRDEGAAGVINVAEYHRHPGNCYQARFVDSDASRGLSNHAWGIAIDLNREENPEGGANHQDPRLIAAFERWGFRWGGVFLPSDPMHFELAGLIQQ